MPSPTQEIIGSLAAILTTTSFAPQVVRTIRTRDTRAISLWMYRWLPGSAREQVRDTQRRSTAERCNLHSHAEPGNEYGEIRPLLCYAGRPAHAASSRTPAPRR